MTQIIPQTLDVYIETSFWGSGFYSNLCDQYEQPSPKVIRVLYELAHQLALNVQLIFQSKH